jgi:hypothetical protein
VSAGAVLRLRRTSVSIEVDGVPLRLQVGRRVPGAVLRELRRAIGGYVTTSAQPSATLAIMGRSHLTVASELHLDVPSEHRGHLPFLFEPRGFDIDEYTLFAVGEWIDAASLLLGGRDQPRLHAAGFAESGRTWIVVGASNAGKTSLALDAVGRGATYLTDERVTVGSEGTKVRVAGLAQPLRIRGDLAERRDSPAARFASTAGTDGFRQLLFCDQFGSVERGWTEPTDLLVLAEDPPEHPTRSWVVRQLLEQCQDAVRIGPEVLVHLARLVAHTRVHVAVPRSLRSVLEVGAAVLAPTGDDPWLEPAATIRVAGGHGLRIAAGVRTLVLGDECVVWLPGTHARVLGLTGGAAAWWRALVDGDEVPTDGMWEPFVGELKSAGSIVTQGAASYDDRDEG